MVRVNGVATGRPVHCYKRNVRAVRNASTHTPAAATPSLSLIHI